MTRTIAFLFLVACSGGGDKDTDDSGTTTPTGEACDLAADSRTCPECSSGPSTCTFGATSVTENSCGDCQARSALYSQLCAEGETADRATIEAETVCAPPTCEVWYDGCSDPCTPLCVQADSIPSSTCDMGCSNPSVPPGECEWTGFACEFVE